MAEVSTNSFLTGLIHSMDTQPPSAQKKRFLLCFSSKDSDGKTALVAHLAPVRGAITIWSVDEVSAGEQIMAEYLRIAADADCALLLLSADFFAEMDSQLFADQVDHLRQLHEERGLQLIPLLWRDCDWKAVSWLAELMPLPIDGIAIRALDMAQQDRALAEIVRHLAGRRSITKCYQPQLRTHLNSMLPFIVTGIGMLLLPLAGVGAGITVSNYQSLFVAIGALGCVYLLCGLFFANISMFPERQRSRIVVILVAALILVTLILGARAARYYRQAYNDLAKKSDAPDAASSINSRHREIFPKQPDLLQPQFDLLPPDASSRIDIFQPVHDLNGQEISQVNADPHPPADQQIEFPSKSEPVVVVKPHARDMGVNSLLFDLSPDSAKMPNDGSMSSTILPKLIPEILIRPDILNEETPHLPDKVKVKFTCQEVSGDYRISINADGSVSNIKIISGIPDADSEIISAIKKWRYKPQRMPVIFAKQFTFFVDDGQGCKPRIVPAILIKKDKISRDDDPHLSDRVKMMVNGSVLTCSYKVCIEKNGSISDVSVIKSINKGLSIEGEDERIIEILKSWKYKPQPVQVCFIQFLEYHVGVD